MAIHFIHYYFDFRSWLIRYSNRLLLLVSGNILLLLFIAYNASSREKQPDTGTVKLAKHLKLTDLCIFTEARYTRHPSMADLHAPFQDAPSSFDYFPSGSLLTPMKRSSSAK